MRDSWIDKKEFEELVGSLPTSKKGRRKRKPLPRATASVRSDEHCQSEENIAKPGEMPGPGDEGNTPDSVAGIVERDGAEVPRDLDPAGERANAMQAVSEPHLDFGMTPLDAIPSDPASPLPSDGETLALESFFELEYLEEVAGDEKRGIGVDGAALRDSATVADLEVPNLAGEAEVSIVVESLDPPDSRRRVPDFLEAEDDGPHCPPTLAERDADRAVRALAEARAKVELSGLLRARRDQRDSVAAVVEEEETTVTEPASRAVEQVEWPAVEAYAEEAIIPPLTASNEPPKSELGERGPLEEGIELGDEERFEEEAGFGDEEPFEEESKPGDEERHEEAEAGLCDGEPFEEESKPGDEVRFGGEVESEDCDKKPLGGQAEPTADDEVSERGVLKERIYRLGERARSELGAGGVVVCDEHGLPLYISDEDEGRAMPPAALLLDISGRANRSLGLGREGVTQISDGDGGWRCLVPSEGGVRPLYLGLSLRRPLERSETDFWARALAEAAHPSPLGD